MISSISIIIIALLAVIALVYKSFVVVGKSEVAVVERLGRFDRVIGEGVHMLIPVIEALKGLEDPYNHKKFLNNKKISLMPEVFSFPKDDRTFFAKNKSELQMKADIVYQITDPYKAVYEVAYVFDAINQLCASVLQKRLIEAQDDIDPIDFLKNQSRNIKEVFLMIFLSTGV